MLQKDHSHDTAEDTNRGTRSEAGKQATANVILERNDGGLKEKNEKRNGGNRQERSYKFG